MLKIAMIGHKRIPSREGGIEIVVEELATRLVEKGHKVEVYNRKGKKTKTKLKNYKGVRIITIPTIKIKSLDALLYSFLSTIRALFGRYDVIHYHAEGPSVMLLIPHFLGIRTVVTIHGLDWKRAKWGNFAAGYLKLGERIAAKYADKVIVLSKNVQNYFMETYQRETQYIPNGVNRSEIRKAEIITTKYNLKKDSYLLFLARIVPEKGLHYLLEAYGKVDTSIKLVIAGESSFSDDYVDKMIQMANKDKRVIRTGFVEGEELAELFSNCYAYILPSDIEGMPISLLEAMSYGCRCLVSDIQENMEVLGDKAVYFKKSNIESLQLALKELINSEKMSENYDMTRFNWDIVTDSVYETYCK